MAYNYKLDTKLQERLLREIHALIEQPANSICADCAARLRARSAFLSVTLGVWLCNRCYGIHRSIGAHITRTKCVGLDAFSPDEVRFMAANGNARVAQRFEAAVPHGTVRPTAASTNSEVERWIRLKYEQRVFYREEPDASVLTGSMPAGQAGSVLSDSLISFEPAAPAFADAPVSPFGLEGSHTTRALPIGIDLCHPPPVVPQWHVAASAHALGQNQPQPQAQCWPQMPLWPASEQPTEPSACMARTGPGGAEHDRRVSDVMAAFR